MNSLHKVTSAKLELGPPAVVGYVAAQQAADIGGAISPAAIAAKHAAQSQDHGRV